MYHALFCCASDYKCTWMIIYVSKYAKSNDTIY